MNTNRTKKRNVSHEDVQRMILKGLKNATNAQAKMPKKYKQGEGVQEVDPNDDVMEP